MDGVNRDLKHDDAFNTTWPPILSIAKCCQVTSLSIERTDHHVLLKASSCLRCLTIRLGRHGRNTSKEGSSRRKKKKKKNKAEEIHLANLVSLGSPASNDANLSLADNSYRLNSVCFVNHCWDV